MKTINKRISDFNKLEFTVYMIVWITVFAFPFFGYRYDELIDWDKLIPEWVKIFAFFVIFLVNMYVMVPVLLFRKRYTAYFLAVSGLAMGLIAVTIYAQKQIEVHNVFEMPPMEIGSAPMELGSSMPAPMGYQPTVENATRSVYFVFADYMIISLLVIGAGTTLKMGTRWLNEEGRRKDLEKEQLRTELALLRHQVNPHFLMNTLNNIHALIDLDTENAKEAVIKLSVLMRYLLYDSSQGKTTLAKELEFMASYIDLMKLRYTEKVAITFIVPTHIPEVQIPPMLFISFLENAFKHGVSYQAQSYVYMKMELVGDTLNCVVRNSKIHKVDQSPKKYSGIGMANVRKNLELLYPDSYRLTVNDKEGEYEVMLSLSL